MIGDMELSGRVQTGFQHELLETGVGDVIEMEVEGLHRRTEEKLRGPSLYWVNQSKVEMMMMEIDLDEIIINAGINAGMDAIVDRGQDAGDEKACFLAPIIHSSIHSTAPEYQSGEEEREKSCVFTFSAKSQRQSLMYQLEWRFWALACHINIMLNHFQAKIA